MKRVLFLSVILSASSMAATIGTCTSTTLNNLIGNPCGLGNKMFSNFDYSGNGAASNVRVEMVGTEFHLIPAFLTDTNSVTPGVAPNITPANYQIVGVKNQSTFSAVAGSAALPNVVNSPSPTFNLVPGSETDGPQSSAGISTATTISTLTGPGGTDGANPGLASLELDYIQANTAIPEPASFALIGVGLVGLGLIRKRGVILT